MCRINQRQIARIGVSFWFVITLYSRFHSLVIQMLTSQALRVLYITFFLLVEIRNVPTVQIFELTSL